MVNPTTARLLISHITLRGPELAQLYALIESQPGIRLVEIRRQLGMQIAEETVFPLEEAPLREALNFLLVAGLIEQKGSPRPKAAFRVRPRMLGVPFSLLLLHHIRHQVEERQQALALVHNRLVADDQVAVTLPAVREAMERAEERSLFAWTGEKVLFWSQLAAHIGLVRRLERSPELLIVPQPSLVLAALRWSSLCSGTTDPMLALLRRIDADLFACFTRHGRVHVGLAQTLIALHRLGQIVLTHSADAAQSVLLCDWRVSEVRIQGQGSIA